MFINFVFPRLNYALADGIMFVTALSAATSAEYEVWSLGGAQL